MRIQHNIMAMNSYRNFTNNNKALSKNLEKLSSGYRINRAGDDAAGLAISEKMRAQITGLKAAQKNAKDGISLVQTAEGSLTEVHSMLNRMLDLADQSANGTYSDAVDRENLQKEVSQLASEIDRIADSTNFNGIKLLDGSLAGISAGKVVGGKIVDYTNTTKATAAQDLSGTLPGGFDTSVKDKITVDGTEISVDWSEMTADELAKLSVDHTSAASADAAAIMEKYINASIDKHNADNGTSVKNIEVDLASATTGYTFTSGSTSSDGKVAFTGPAATTKSVMGMVFAATTSGANVSTPGFATGAGKPAAATDTFEMEIDGIKLQITTTKAGDAATTAADLHTQLQTDIRKAVTDYNTATGSTAIDPNDITVSMTKDGKLEVKGAEGQRIGFSDKEGSMTAQKLGLTADTVSAGGGGLTLQIGEDSESYNQLSVSINDMHTAALGLSGISIAKQPDGAAAVEKIKKAINTVSGTRGTLGSLQNRLDHTINNLSVMHENIQDAEATIRDVDVAEEMMDYTKNNILVQSAQAMLAQANQVPQGVLQLLG